LELKLLWACRLKTERDLNESLESRPKTALSPSIRGAIERFGGLSLEESTHLVDEVSLIERMDVDANKDQVQLFVVRDRGRYTLPVWVDHFGSAGTRYATGDLKYAIPLFPQAWLNCPEFLTLLDDRHQNP